MLHTSASSFRTIVNYRTFIGVEPLSHPQRLLSVFFVSSLDKFLLTKNLVSPLPSNVCTGGLSPSYVPLLQDIEHLLDREFVVLKYCPREVIEIFAATLSIAMQK